jgi:hypothetical protein
MSRPNGVAEELPKIFGGIPDEFSPREPITEGVQLILWSQGRALSEEKE